LSHRWISCSDRRKIGGGKISIRDLSPSLEISAFLTKFL